MSRSVVFETSSLIPIEAFTTMGINSKPNSINPIGFFGTGLKYAVAVLCRLKIPVTVWIGKDQYVFYTTEKDFRGKTFSMVRMKKRKGLFSKWTYHNLPFTTELGKNWELWQVFRELEANTRDENGSTYEWATEYIPIDGATAIIVESDDFVEEYNKRFETFLQTDKYQLAHEDENLQIFRKESKHLYYRGMRVHTLEHPSLFTYNLKIQSELTEDRTLKYFYTASGRIQDALLRSVKDPQVLSRVVSASDGFFEGRMNFQYDYSMSEEMKAIVSKKIGRGGYVGSSIRSLYDSMAPPKVSTITIADSIWQVIIDSVETHVSNKEERKAALEDLADKFGRTYSEEIPF